ncbi:hypothetical protein E3N88_13811 [Mikania micrantha]|uniref:AT-hook motif nuclear-localized protein n=1 Tax=Mikania micrantha TaxID=192012 RepID=A0A5N6P1C2_9ASTR|nr:hypothetical protein E3N88_13811 [Mikania micrantha]
MDHQILNIAHVVRDAGLPRTTTLMTPYWGVRYHLKEYSTRAPENSKELFNLRHASLRNAIERAFGVLKKRIARLQKNDNIKVETIKELDDLLTANEVTLENEYNNDDDIQILDSMTFHPLESSNAKKNKSKKRKLDDYDEAVNSMLISSIANVANAIGEGNKILERVYHQEYTGEEIYKELELMGLESHEVPMALNFLATNQGKARTLFTCPLQIRIGPAKKKRGRPRKYSPSSDGNIALGLAPSPVNTVPNLAGGVNLESSNDGSGGTLNVDSSAKKHRGRPPGSGKKQLDALGLPGVGFTPHVIIVKAGEVIL